MCYTNKFDIDIDIELWLLFYFEVFFLYVARVVFNNSY